MEHSRRRHDWRRHAEPRPQDDLLLTTQQLTINEDGIHTLSTVDMRLGPHQGYGRELREFAS